MLGKLIKHEFKSTAHSMLGVFLAAGITFVIMLLVFLVKIKSLMVISSVVLGAIAVALFSIVSTFNKSLYGAQGYLSFTLPVTSKQLLASKTIVSLTWVAISFIFAIAVTVFLVFYWVAQTSENLKQTIQAVYNLLRDMEGMPDPQTAIRVIVSLVIVLFLRALFLIFKVAFSLAVANTRALQKYNTIFMAILIYVGIFILISGVNVAAQFIPVQLVVGSSGIGMSIGEAIYGLPEGASTFFQLPILGYVFEAFVCIMLYIITGDIMTNRVNIK